MDYQGIIVILLALIVYFLYQIAKQLSYITGVRLRLPLGQQITFKKFEKKQTKDRDEEKKLTN